MMRLILIILSVCHTHCDNLILIDKHTGVNISCVMNTTEHISWSYTSSGNVMSVYGGYFPIKVFNGTVENRRLNAGLLNSTLVIYDADRSGTINCRDPTDENNRGVNTDLVVIQNSKCEWFYVPNTVVVKCAACYEGVGARVNVSVDDISVPALWWYRSRDALKNCTRFESVHVVQTMTPGSVWAYVSIGNTRLAVANITGYGNNTSNQVTVYVYHDNRYAIICMGIILSISLCVLVFACKK